MYVPTATQIVMDRSLSFLHCYSTTILCILYFHITHVLVILQHTVYTNYVVIECGPCIHVPQLCMLQLFKVKSLLVTNKCIQFVHIHFEYVYMLYVHSIRVNNNNASTHYKLAMKACSKRYLNSSVTCGQDEI